MQAIDKALGREPKRDWDAVWSHIEDVLHSRKSRWKAPEQKLFRRVFTRKDPEAEPVARGGRGGGYEPDADLRDFENVPLKDDIDAYFEHEVHPPCTRRLDGPQQEQSRLRDQLQPVLLPVHAASASGGDRCGAEASGGEDHALAAGGDGVSSVTATQRKLKYVATINDETLGEDTDPDFEIQYVDISNVDSSGGLVQTVTCRFEDAPSRARRCIRDGDVIISTVRTYLQAITQVQSPPENMIASTGFAVVRPRPEFHANYLKYALRESGFLAEVEKRSVGVNYPAINTSDLASIRVHVRPQQRAIADYLDRETARLDALVAVKERVLGLLAEKRRALITRAVTRGLNPRAPFRDSGIPWLGEIPAHWEIRRLKHISPYITVGVVVNPSSYVVPDGVPFLYGSDITEEGINTDSARRVPLDVSRSELAKTCLRTGDLVTVRVGAPGITAVVPLELDGANCASIMLTRGAASFDSNWLAYAMNSSVGKHQVALVQYGAAQEQFNIGHAVAFSFAVPSLTEQRDIVSHIDSTIGAVDTLRKATTQMIELLKERRAALISAAVTGQLEVT